jgi:alanine dehydrogenase
MQRPKTLILSHSDIVASINLPMAIDAVRDVMAAHGRGQVIEPNLIHADAPRGEFHIKTGGLLGQLGPGGEGVFGLKANGGFFGNHRLGLPNIVGLITLADAKTGAPLAVLDSVEISRIRTGAATAVAAQVLARKNSTIATVLGTGKQAQTQVEALASVLPLSEVRLVGRDLQRTAQRAETIQAHCGVAVNAWSDADSAVATSDVIVTCTPSRQALFSAGAVPKGAFIAAVGADSPGKQELDPTLVASSLAVADVSSQCIRVGELQHPIGAGLMQIEDIHAEIGQLLIGAKPGRTSADQITLYDSTGTALQDVAVGLVVYEQALKAGLGTAIQLGQ